MALSVGLVLAHGDVGAVGTAATTGPVALDLAALLLGLAVGALYAVGVWRLVTAGRHWPVGRSVAFGGAVATFLFATQAGPAVHDTTLFSAHVVQHLLLGMVVGGLAALGAPITLLLQASPRSVQTRAVALLHSRVARVLTHPVVVWLLFTMTLYVLYATPLYELSLRNDVVHGAVHLHFVFAGFVFFAVVLGTDPVGRRLPAGARLLMVLATVPFHAFLGIALTTGSEPLAVEWYESVVRPTTSTILEDQRVGGAIMWGGGEILTLTAAAVVMVQWMREDRREAARLDRRRAASTAATDTSDADPGGDPDGRATMAPTVRT